MEAGVRGLTGTDRRSVRAAVLGSPISHSLSPALHTAAYAALGLTWWRYDAIECDEAGLSALLDGCGPDWAGLSLTMPLKRTVLPLLDRVEPLATQVGCANTVVFAAAQRLGYNTDVAGIVGALGEHGIGKQNPVGPALIIGGGATACAALAALSQLGEKSVSAAVRNADRAGDLSAAAARLGITLEFVAFDAAALHGVRLVISTVPAGAADVFAENFPALASPPQAVLDVVYHPWPTALAVAAQQAGTVLVSGFDLLLHQAARQVELMTDRAAPLSAMRQAGLAELSARAGSG
ncbi:MAG TPA: shikimate dehydrogenase [Streptosporangiaceae bacterium]|nr:shikimate dehydrogenase [Streptosporangiaceae bacterium]